MQLQHGVDESYKLRIPVQGNPLYAHIEVGTNKLISFLEVTNTTLRVFPCLIECTQGSLRLMYSNHGSRLLASQRQTF